MSEQTPDSSTDASGFPGATGYDGEAEPSMEDILASIRKIIADDAEPTPMAVPLPTPPLQTTIAPEVVPDMRSEPDVFSDDPFALDAISALDPVATVDAVPEPQDDFDIDALLSSIDVVEPEAVPDTPQAISGTDDFVGDVDFDDAVLDLDFPMIDDLPDLSTPDLTTQELSAGDLVDAPTAPLAATGLGAAALGAKSMGEKAATSLLVDPGVAPSSQGETEDMDALLSDLLGDMDLVDGDVPPGLDVSGVPEVAASEPAVLTQSLSDDDDLLDDLLSEDFSVLETEFEAAPEITDPDMAALDDLIEPALTDEDFENLEDPILPASARADMGEDEDLDLVKSLMADLTDEDVSLAEASAANSAAETDILDDILDMTLEDEIAMTELVADDADEIGALVDTPAPERPLSDGPSLADIAASADADASAVPVAATAAAAGAALLGGATLARSAEPVVEQDDDILADIPVASTEADTDIEDLPSPGIAAEAISAPGFAPTPAELSPAQPAIETPMETPMPRAALSDTILDEVTEEATMGAFAQLNTVVEEKAVYSERGPRIGDLVSEALKPMLKEWLDANLKGIVERAVAKEVKRISSGK